EALREDLHYWQSRLAGAPSVLDLPTDRPRSASRSSAVGTVDVALPAGLSARLRQVGDRHAATLFMVMFAAFNVLLFRWTGQRDAVIGAPISGRRRVGLEGLIGCFVNTVAVRTDLSGNPKFSELLERVRAECLDAYDH